MDDLSAPAAKSDLRDEMFSKIAHPGSKPFVVREVLLYRARTSKWHLQPQTAKCTSLIGHRSLDRTFPLKQDRHVLFLRIVIFRYCCAIKA